MVKEELRSQRGFTLVEVIVGVALIASVGIAIMGGMLTIFKAQMVANTQTTGMSAAQSQLEYVSGIQGNFDEVDMVWYYDFDDTIVPDGYTIWTVPRGANLDGTGQPVQCATGPIGGLVGIPWNSDPDEDEAVITDDATDADIQKVTVIVKKDDKIVTSLSLFKAKQ